MSLITIFNVLNFTLLCSGMVHMAGDVLTQYMYRVIHKSLRDFGTRLRNNQDRHGRNEHINR